MFSHDDFSRIDSNVSSLVDLLEAKGISWGEYQEDMVSPRSAALLGTCSDNMPSHLLDTQALVSSSLHVFKKPCTDAAQHM